MEYGIEKETDDDGCPGLCDKGGGSGGSSSLLSSSDNSSKTHATKTNDNIVDLLNVIASKGSGDKEKSKQFN